MQRIRWFGLFAVAALLYAAALGTAAEKGTVVDINGFKATAPPEWKEETAGGLRFMQFKLPKVKNDKFDGELVVFKDVMDTVEGNIKRWKDDFKAPEGKKIDDLTKVANGAMGALTGVKDEVEARVRDQIARILDGMDIPRRDEFDAVKAMAAKAREENEELRKQIAELQSKLEGR